MSRSRKHSKAPGTEFWSRRPFSNKHGSLTGKFSKRCTHRSERQQGKRTTASDRYTQRPDDCV